MPALGFSGVRVAMRFLSVFQHHQPAWGLFVQAASRSVTPVSSGSLHSRSAWGPFHSDWKALSSLSGGSADAGFSWLGNAFI